MWQTIRKALLFENLYKPEMKAVKAQITEENCKFCITWAVFHVLFWSYCLVMSFYDPLYEICRDIYTVGLCVGAAMLYLSLFARKYPVLVQPVAIVLDELLLITGILIARNLAPQTIVIFAAVLIVPVSFITNTLSNFLILLLNIILCVLLGSGRMEADTYKWVISNLCIFSFLGLMLGHFVNRARFERYVFGESSAELAELQARYAHYDQLTNLQNRRAYDECIDELKKDLPAGCRVISADVNGLKEANDTQGHAAGDELITATAECFRRSFEGIDRIYRTGGDEFTIIITDENYDIDAALERLKQCSSEWKGTYIGGFTISAGVASAEEYSDIDELLKAADKKMYESKRNYYISTGRDRRRR